MKVSIIQIYTIPSVEHELYVFGPIGWLSSWIVDMLELSGLATFQLVTRFNLKGCQYYELTEEIQI